jgi:hypothetical protein
VTVPDWLVALILLAAFVVPTMLELHRLLGWLDRRWVEPWLRRRCGLSGRPGMTAEQGDGDG